MPRYTVPWLTGCLPSCSRTLFTAAVTAVSVHEMCPRPTTTEIVSAGVSHLGPFKPHATGPEAGDAERGSGGSPKRARAGQQALPSLPDSDISVCDSPSEPEM